MPDDNVLRVVAQVDLSSILSGVPNAASVVQASTARMASAFQQVSTTSAQVDTSSKAVSHSFIKEAGDADNLKSKISNLQAEYQKLLVTQERGVGELPFNGTKLRGEFEEAREGIRGLGEELGITMPRYVSTFLSHLEGLAPVMAQAFSVIAVVGFAEVISELIDKVVDGAAAWVGWDEAATKAYADMLAGNQRMYQESLRLTEEQRKLSEIGVTGFVKIRREQDNNAASIREYTNEFHKAQKEVARLSEEHEKLKGVAAWLTGEITGRIEKEKEVNRELDKQNQNVSEFANRIVQLKAEGGKIDVQLKVTGAEQAIAQAKAVAEATKTLGLAQVSFQEDAAKQLYEAGQITHAEEISSLMSAEEQKYQVIKRSLERRKALALQKESETGAPSGPEVAHLNAEAEAAELAHQSKLGEIQTHGRLEQQQADNAAQLAQVEGARKVADARAAVEDQNARELRATRKISIAEELADFKQAETERYDAQLATLQKQLAIAKEYPEKNKAQIVGLNADIEAAALEHDAKLTQIQANGDNQRRAEAQREMREELTVSRELAAINLQLAKQSADDQLKHHQIGIDQWVSLEKKAINTWADDQKAALQKELNEAKLIYGEQGAQYKLLMAKLKQLDLQREKEVQQVNQKIEVDFQQTMNKITTQMSSSLARWAMGWESTNQAWKTLWQSMTTTFAKNVMEMAAEEMIGLALHKKAALQTVAISAKTGAAEAYAAMAGIPYVGPIIAPIAAAVTFSAIMAFGAFEKGGLTGDKEMLAHLHPNEMVLPAHIATPLQAMLSSNSTLSAPTGLSALSGAGGDGGRGRDISSSSTRSIKYGDVHHHGDIVIHQAGGSSLSTEEITAQIRMAMRRGMIPSGI